MPEHLLITINPHEDGEHCGECHQKEYYYGAKYCQVFDGQLSDDHKRLPACLDAAQRARDLAALVEKAFCEAQSEYESNPDGDLPSCASKSIAALKQILNPEGPKS